MAQLAPRSGEGGFRWLGDDIYKPQNQCKRKEGRRKDHGGNNEGITLCTNQVPAMPIIPTKSRIFATSLAVKTPLLAAR